MKDDELFDVATRLVLETRRASCTLLQRRLTIGYARACLLLDQMQSRGAISGFKDCGTPREVLMTLEEYEKASAQ